MSDTLNSTLCTFSKVHLLVLELLQLDTFIDIHVLSVSDTLAYIHDVVISV